MLLNWLDNLRSFQSILYPGGMFGNIGKCPGIVQIDVKALFRGLTCRVYLQKLIDKIGPIQVVVFFCLVQLRLRIRRPLKISYRSLYCVVLFNGENTSNYITLTFASSCIFCINSNLSLAPCWIFQIFFWILDTLNDFSDVTLACDDSFKELRISNPHDSRSFFKDP